METVIADKRYYLCMPTSLKAEEVNAALENSFGVWYGYNGKDSSGVHWSNFFFWDERDAIFAKLKWPDLRIQAATPYKLTQDWDGFKKYV